MKWILTSVMMVFWAGAAICGEYVIIVNSGSSLSSVSATELKRLYTGRMENMGGNKMAPANLSLSDAVSVSFLKEVVGKETADYKSFWLAQQIRGGSSAPVVKKSADAMITFVKENPNAIGYVPKGAATDGVKVLEVK
ncbi:MAG: hypothetical protein ACOCW2_00605 [Chitinivibrionales bacterium]